MALEISANHPLRKLFAELIQKHLVGAARLEDPQIAGYVGDILVTFTHVNNLYRIRDARGKRLEEVSEMLIASNPLLQGRSFDREREVRKHIGDYTLFLTGLFPEYVASLPRRGLRLDGFLDYLKVGKESYGIVSSFDLFEYRNEAPLFRQLSDRFEACVYGLNLVKQDLEASQREYFARWRSTLQ